jgi:transposase
LVKDDLAASPDEVCMRMMTVPGAGPVAALTFKAAVDGLARFKRPRTGAARFGLTPRRYRSGGHDTHGRISKTKDRDARATLYAAANALLMRIKGRRRAVVAVARKLAVLRHRMRADGTKFRPEKVAGMT